MTHLLFINAHDAILYIKHQLRLLLLVTTILLINSEAHAVATITKATGGTSIPADRAENAIVPSYTTLGNVVITEGAVTDFAVGTNVTFTLIAPSGWKFNPSFPVSVSATPGGDISSTMVVSVTATLITLQTTVSGTSNFDALTISGVQVRANEGGNIPTSANITKGGTEVISGCSAGAVLANLSQAAGAVNKLLVTLPGQTFSDASLFSTSGNSGTPTAQTAGTAFTITKIRAVDQFYNVVTSYFGTKTLTYSGPSNGLTAPTYVTNVSFASGVSSTALTTNLKKAETVSISVSDGTYSGPASTSLTVNPGVHTKFLVQNTSGGNIGTQITDMPFNIKVTAADANNNACSTGPNTFTGTADITSTGTMTSGDGTTASFTAGVLSPWSVSISDGGTFTITATNSAGIQTGASNSFQVTYPPASVSALFPTCITPGDPDFDLEVDGSNFTPSSIVRFNGVDRITTYIDPFTLIAAIPASDIATPDVYDITVYVPGTGTTAPLTLNMNSSVTDNVSICDGSFHVLPDGSIESMAGTYISVIPSVSGCDSTITTNLTVTPSPSRDEYVDICPGAIYTLPDGTPQDTPGMYTSIVTNISGCDSVITTYLGFHSTPMIIATPVQIDCFGGRGSVNLSAVSGTAPYTFGGDATSNLVEGDYNYTVTDANGCEDYTIATIDPAPDALDLIATPTQIDCHGNTGSVDLVAEGGTPSYTISGDSTIDLTAGVYHYQVTDNNGCVAYANATISTAPAALNATASSVATPCGGSTGVATVNVSGGTPPYSYMWDASPLDANSISGLTPGVYTVEITDSRGCSMTKSVTVASSNPITVNITGSTGICPGGTASLCAGAGFDTYLWSTGETTQCITPNTVDTFTVTVTDINGCTGVKSVATHASTTPNCTITGGALCLNSVLILRAPTGYASYTWSNNVHTSTNNVRSAGTYSVTVRNSDGCASTCSYTVNSPLRVTSTKSDAKCSNEFKGSATVNASAGIPPYTYLWSNGATTATVTGLTGGSYTSRVTDAGGCLVVSSSVINVNKTTSDYSSSAINFNSNAIAQNTYIWFTAVANVTYTGNYPVTIRFINQNINTVGLNLIPADAKLIITNAVSQASTTFVNGEWVTTAPPNITGNYFVSGFAHQAPAAIAANLNAVKWRGIWTASSSCVTKIKWKWSAATYSNFSTVNSAISIQPVDDASASPFGNSDLAGTPENFKAFCIPGALSAGGSDYIGTYSALVSRVPCSTPDVCNVLRIGDMVSAGEGSSTMMVNAYPNPFSSKTTIEFERADASGHLTIDIYSMTGQKMTRIYDNDIEAGVVYTIDFDAGDLSSGIYFYKLVCDGEEVRGKLYLQK